MRIVAQRPDGEQLLIDLDGFTGRIYDVGPRIAHPPWVLASLFARGYWTTYGGPQNAEELLERASVRALDEPAERALAELKAELSDQIEQARG